MKKFSLMLTLVLFSIGTMLAQRTVTGTISDDTGEPLIGATVIVVGTSSGTVTDIDGTYSVKVPEGATALKYTYTGYSDQTVELGASNVMDITMTEGVALDEVVVTAIGLEANRRQLGYAVQNVDAEEVLASKETNLVNALNGKVAGVNIVSSSGSPGASANIRIRGAVSINGSNSPLFVIDGVPISNDEAGNDVDGVDQSNRAIDINPNDVESISVLKGAAATALYGIRAANGAIIITTKKGVAGQPKLTYSVSYSFDEVNKLPGRQSSFAQGRPADTDDDDVPDTRIYRGPGTAEGFSWGPAISELEYDANTPNVYDNNGAIVARGSGTGQAVNAYDPYDFFQIGNTVDANLGLQGGSENVTYYFSGGYLNSTGIVPNADFQRLTFKATTEAQLGDKWSAGLSANYINSGGMRIQRGSNLNGVMLGLLRTTPTFDNSNGLGEDAVDDESAYVAPDGSQRSYRAGVYDNPYWTVNKNPFEDNVNRIIGYATVGYEINDWLSLKYKYGVDRYTDARNSAFDINPSPFGFNWNDGSVRARTIENTNLNSDLFLSFNKTISEDFSFSGIVGHNYYSLYEQDNIVDGNQLSITNFYHVSNAANLTTAQFIDRKEVNGVLGTVDLNFKDFLFINLNGRNDWSSTLPNDNNSFGSYGASVGFAFTDAFNMQNNPILPYGKLRLSYGKVGNDASTFRTATYFNPAQAGGDGFITTIEFPAFGVNAFERSGLLGNSMLVPESTRTFEAGIELQFFKGRLGLDATYYNSTSDDLIIDVQVSAASGFQQFTKNAAKIENKGFEIVANATPVRTAKFVWDINANFTTYENNVLELDEGIEEIGLAGFVSTSSRAVVGEPYGAIFGNGFQRNDDGRMIIGEDGWPLQDPEQNVYGDPNPDFTLGVRNSFTLFNSLRASALIDIRQGGDMWCGTCGVMDYFGTSEISGDLRGESIVWDGVKADGSENTTSVAYADVAAGVGGSYWTRYGFGGITEMNIFDTSWVRLREVTLSYSLTAGLAQKIGMSDATISVAGRNLWLNTDYPGIDPETNLTGASNGFGLDYFNMPNTKSVSVTLRGSF